ncbi:hypothetical protein H6P81_018258 [Aristolochia fimbriata]|uniref:Uncharacterized protein n=1 Tax=Aristolochia fimbriata TaxID=158543 RepID=A0AAV7E2E5_ARIFI|nr:hypothetical protein H6P81_018258 [Aristolochia fimbriata]
MEYEPRRRRARVLSSVATDLSRSLEVEGISSFRRTLRRQNRESGETLQNVKCDVEVRLVWPDQMAKFAELELDLQRLKILAGEISIRFSLRKHKGKSVSARECGFSSQVAFVKMRVLEFDRNRRNTSGALPVWFEMVQ